MKYGLYTYSDYKGYLNIGDHIQSIAARQYYPHTDVFIEKENISAYDGEDTKMILNGWYIRKPESWPPNPCIKPLLTSIHINSNAANKFLSNKNTVDYLKRNGPVGCRDMYTKKVLEDKGVEAYYSSCLTLTLNKTIKKTKNTDEVLIVDPALRPPKETPLLVLKLVCKGVIFYWLNAGFRRNFKKQHKGYFYFKGIKGLIKKYFQIGALSKCISKNILLEAKYIKHSFHKSLLETDEERFSYANDLLQRYANAKLIITSRIHCALPATSLGTPVVFIDVGYRNFSDSGRISSMNKFFNNIRISPEGISNDFGLDGNFISSKDEIKTKSEHVKFSNKLKQQCEEFIKS
ncbi:MULTISPECIES: polysaccharide pyruvyl transferase family protein [unclassified Carboxylicivirga]|uniref:polysaccharide pyruvyl transferase family protein n=1 Tax=Carboxylicivirga TaxID=1628153 RepID=UPI003D354927